MSGPFATASRRYIAIHQVSLLSLASYTVAIAQAACDVHDNDDNNNDNA